jgi:hypothetical protein
MDDTITARVAYLRYLKDEFNRVWPHGAIRSSEPEEREAFRVAKWKIDHLTKQIEDELR